MITPRELDLLRARFEGVAQTIGNRLSAANSRVIALVAKWSKDDLVPGLSDMDFRVVCDEAATADDWIKIDWHIGQIHRQMVQEHPEWNRINEHTAGAGINLRELLDKSLHHPEYSVWTVWWGNDEWLKQLLIRTLSQPLKAVDEHYHLSRFLSYYSPYIHGIDPPINLGEFEPKYALHSRCWHYFAPPMLSAATLLARKHFVSKREGLLWLAEHSFAADQVDAVLHQVDSHYETDELSNPEQLEKFEQLLFTGFEQLLEPVCKSVKHLDLPSGLNRMRLQQHLKAHIADAFVELLENVRYARIRAGRYYFYFNAPAHFSAERQLVQEQAWTQKLVRSTLKLLRQLHKNDRLSMEECVAKAKSPLTNQELKAIQFVMALAATNKTDGALRAQYLEGIEQFPIYYRLLENALQQIWKSSSISDKNHSELARIDGHQSLAAPTTVRLPSPIGVKM